MPATPPHPPEPFTDEWFDAQDADERNDINFARREAAQERAAYITKMDRNRALAAQDRPARTHRGTTAQNIGSALDTAPATSSPLAPRLERGEKDMHAKFPGPCKRCDVRIQEGERIAYIRGKGARHYPTCPGNPVQTVVSRVRMMTAGQRELIKNLQVERGVPHNVLPDMTTFAEASTLIGDLIKMPRVSRKKRTVELHGLPEGRYAVNTDEGHLAFYNVTERGVFLQLSDSLNAMPEVVEQAIIAKILVDPAEAARTYGRELEICAVCGRTLTNDVSRAYGIGPVCRKNTGW